MAVTAVAIAVSLRAVVCLGEAAEAEAAAADVGLPPAVRLLAVRHPAVHRCTLRRYSNSQ